MRSFRLSRALALSALAALLAACAHNNTTNATNAGGASVPSTSTTNQTTTTTVQTSATNQSNAVGAASNSAGAGSASSSAKKIDACALLTSDDIKSVQGEEVRETKPSQTGEGALAASQCFFATATFNKSVSLQVTRGADAPSVRRYWDTLFARAKEESGKSERERERDKDREKKKEGQNGAQPKGGEEEEESTPPVPVKGVGEEAFWASSNVNGILYALKGDAFVRVSIGGADKPDVRLRKSKALAQKALARL
jgi:hypothetical protein